MGEISSVLVSAAASVMTREIKLVTVFVRSAFLIKRLTWYLDRMLSKNFPLLRDSSGSHVTNCSGPTFFGLWELPERLKSLRYMDDTLEYRGSKIARQMPSK